MSRRDVDPETLAALIDGRLDARVRRRVIEQLAEDEELREAHADALAVMDQVLRAESAEGSPAPSSVSRLNTHRLRHRDWLAMAASIALLGLLPWALLRTRGGEVEDPAGFAELIAAHDALPAGWENPGWSATRGPGEPLTAEARAARLGAKHVALELAVRGQDLDRAQRFSAEMAALLDQVPAGSAVAVVYREIGRRAGEEPLEALPLLDRGSESLLELVDNDHVLLGAWAGAAQIAVLRHDERFFRSPETRRFLRRMTALESLPPRTRDSLAQISQQIRASRLAWDALGSTVTDLAREVGG